MPQHSANFPNLVDLDPVLEEIYFQQYAQFSPLLLGRVYGVRQSDKAKETNQRIGSFGDPQVFNGQIFYDEADRDYDITYTHDHLTLGFKVERTLIEDNQYSGIFDQAANLGQSFARKIVKDEAATFENAFTTAGYDGQALCSASHPRSRTDATTVSNYLGAKALTSTNLEDAVIQLKGLGDDLGNETNAMATLLIVGRMNRKVALELTGSELTPESANNAINVHSSLQTIVHPYITGKKWFVVDGPMALMTLKWFWRLMPTFGVEDDNSSTLMRSYFGRMRYSRGWSDFRFVVGSNPS